MSEELPQAVSIPMMPSMSHTDNINHSVVTFLRRPQLISSFKWPSSAERSQNILTPLVEDKTRGLLVPEGLFKDMAVKKLDGFTSFKATCVVRLQLNSQPFQCGRLLIAAAPVPELLGHRNDFTFCHVGQAQNVHNVQMDIAKQTEVEIRIPFISPYSAYDLIEGKFNWAECRCLVYSKLNAKATSCLQCLCWAHFEDIQMGAPTSGGVKNPKQQSGAIKQERKKESSGNFTGTLSKLGNALGNGINAASKTLAAFGWSKPVLSKPSCVVLNRPQEGFNYMDGIDQSLVLGMTAGNAVDPIPNLVGVGVDETSFDVLKRIPQFIGTFSYSDKIMTCDQDPKPVRLWDCAVSPCTYLPACLYIQPKEDIPNNVVSPYTFHWKQPTTLNYITSPFLYWTGSLVYTFKFVKTDYHSGRVEISYHPFVNKVDETRMDYVYKTIIDLRENSEVSITVPYISPQPWKRVNTYLDPVNPDPPTPGRVMDSITGILYVRALTPLICASEIISNEIEVLVEMRAGDDFEVSGPVTSKYLPFSFQNPNSLSDNPKEQCGTGKFSLRTPTSSTWSQTNGDSSNDTIKLTVNGTAKIRMLAIEYYYQIIRGNGASVVLATITNDWNTDQVNFNTFGQASERCHSMIYENLEEKDAITFTWKSSYISNRDQITKYLKISVTPINDGFQHVHLDDDQLPLPSALEGGSGSIVKIDDTQLPLKTYLTNGKLLVEQDKDPLPVTLQESPLDVYVTNTDPIKVNPISDEPYKVQVQDQPIKVTQEGDPSGEPQKVKIDESQLPLWVSEWDVATGEAAAAFIKNRLNRKMIYNKNPKQQSKSVATAGTTETRTRAMEGWMPPSITGDDKDAHRPSTSKFCAGEVFTSFRQYSRRFAFSLVNAIKSSEQFHVQPVELIRPGALHLRVTNDVGHKTQLALYAPNSKSEVSGSPLAFVAGMYAFYRGSLRVKVWTDPRVNPPELLSGHLEYARQIKDHNIIEDNIENFMTPINFETPRVKQLAEFQIPYYSPTIVSSTWSHGIDNQFDVPLTNLVLSVPDTKTNTQGPIKIAVAGGDDMDFHQFIGPPPVINIGDLTTEDRMIHYPPTGFTPTQKVIADSTRPREEPAIRFDPVPYTALTVKGNYKGESCPAIPNTFVRSVQQSDADKLYMVRQQRKMLSIDQQSRDEVDKNIQSPDSLDIEDYNARFNPRYYILD